MRPEVSRDNSDNTGKSSEHAHLARNQLFMEQIEPTAETIGANVENKILGTLSTN